MYDIDTERLINAVKIRPPLYGTVHDKMCKSPGTRKHREMLWHEIAEELHDNWNYISQLHKVQFVREVQKRWKSLRTCFTRELCMQKRERLKREANMLVKRRKRYEYFNKLIFLKDQYNESNIRCSDHEDSRDQLDAGDVLEYGDEEFERPNGVDVENYQTRQQSTGVEERVLDILKNVREDDDRHFVLSLVPSFKDMSITKKLRARIEVLKVLQNKH